MIEIIDFEMQAEYVNFIVKKGSTQRLVEIYAIGKGRTSMTDIYEFDFLEDEEWEELDKLVSALSGMVMCNFK